MSAASVYEIVVKAMFGKLDVGASPSDFIRAERESRGILLLPIGEEAAFAVERLFAIHADPFDRLLIAQSIVSEMTLIPGTLLSHGIQFALLGNLNWSTSLLVQTDGLFARILAELTVGIVSGAINGALIARVYSLDF